MMAERTVRNDEHELTVKVCEDLKATQTMYSHANKDSEKDVIALLLKIKDREQYLINLKEEDVIIESDLKDTISRIKMFDHIVMNISVLLEMESFLSKLDNMDKTELERVFLSKKDSTQGNYGWQKLTRTDTCSNIHEIAVQLAAKKDHENESLSHDNSGGIRSPAGRSPEFKPHGHRHPGGPINLKLKLSRSPTKIRVTEADPFMPSKSSLPDNDDLQDQSSPNIAQHIYPGSPLPLSGRRIRTETEDPQAKKEDVNI
jgi:hypothetical protein